jgi:uncharacterized surface protein with fasciclin (FAS1) repeats
MKLKNLLFLLLVLLSVRQLNSQSVVDVVVNSPDHNTLEAAILAAGLDGALSGEGPFTVFAPTDDAFAALPAGTVEALLNDIPALTAILTYHVASGDVRSTDLSDNMVIPTLNGANITVTINNEGVFINNAQVTVADITADNGVVHVINAVLLPPVSTTTVFDIIAGSDDHNTLEAAILAAGLDGALSGEGPFTVFAPTDDAFAALPAGTVEALLNDIPTLTAILTYHVASGDVRSTDLSDNMVIPTLNGANITVTINNEGVFINNAQVTVADITADNGVVHVINAVLLPPVSTTTVFDIIAGSDDHNTLEAAILAAGLDGALSGEGPFTVFAPTDDAFAALPAGTVEALLNDIPTLTAILTYHVASGDVRSTDLSDNMVIPTLNGANITVTINNEGVFINNAQVTVADITADNGVVHVINAVLLPPVSTTTVFDIIAGSDDHNTLEAAILAAGLDGALSGEGPFTVFAPTDDAFAALPPGTIEALLEDIPTLTSILAYHVSGGTLLSSDFTDGQLISTLNGANVTVTINDDGVFINNARVTMADITADNGVVHVIDAVLLPPSNTNTVFDIIAASEDHNTLEAAILAAGLESALKGEGPFTVFAPTDAAFAALPAGTVEALLANPQALTDVLLYHALNEFITQEDFEFYGNEFPYYLTLNGKTVTARVTADAIFINDIPLTITDLIADNGVVHVIDAVLLAPDSTIVDVVRNSPVHTLLETALDIAEFSLPLEGYGPFTLFAPTDDAILALGQEAIDELLADPYGLLSDVLAYHLVGDSILSDNLFEGQRITTLNGQDVVVRFSPEGIFINDARVIIADIRADNGVVHVIDAVLLPKRTVLDIINQSQDHFLLSAVIELAGLSETLRSDGQFTVFAPTDDAILALPEELIASLVADPQGALRDLLLYHVLEGAVFSDELENGTQYLTLNGKDIAVTINNEGVFINNARVTVADLRADNGVVHVIDAVLIPEDDRITIWDIIVNSPDHNILEAAVRAAGLDGILATAGPLTVFAPTDNAFNALPAGTIESLLSDPTGLLTDILLYHAVPGAVPSSALTNGQTITTILGEVLTVTINSSGIFINDARVTVADIVTENGIVHVIDAVLLPPSSTGDVPGSSDFTISPNPAHNQTQIVFKGLSGQPAQLQIFDIQGRLINMEMVNPGGQTLDISDLKSGLYYVRLNNGNNSITKKLVRQ